jgi:hypothetical protein
MDKFGKAVSMDELCRAAKECRRGVSNKVGPVEFNLHRLSSCKRLKDDITSGRYKIRPGTKVIVYRPKRRVATAPWFRDRVWQRSMCNNGVYDDLTRSFLLDNIACQKGKGADMAIRRVVKMLQRLHREDPGAPVYGVHLDVKKYFPSTPHEELKEMDRNRISDERFLPFLYEIIDSSKDERPREETEADPFGERGTGLGSQINQLHQITLLDPMDHDLKHICRDYIRYNDDILMLSHDRKRIEEGRLLVKSHLEGLGLIMTDKAGIFTADNGFYFLRKRFIMTRSGKIIIRLHPKALAEERQTLRGLKRCIEYGLRTMEDVKVHYQSWIANAEYAGDAPIRAMDKFYAQLFRERPQYKRKKRYLYGNNPETRRKARKSRKGKQDAPEGKRCPEGEDRVHGDLRLSGDAGRRRGGAE